MIELSIVTAGRGRPDRDPVGFDRAVDRPGA